MIFVFKHILMTNHHFNLNVRVHLLYDEVQNTDHLKALTQLREFKYF